MKKSVPTKLKPLEFKLFRLLQPVAKRGRKWLVAVSGGKDSVTLLSLLMTLKDRLDIELAVAHVHHGKSTPEQTRARTEALRFSRDLAARVQIPFFEVKAQGDKAPASQSEEPLRTFRHEALEAVRARNGFDFLVFAHHADDLFETRLLRMIRGTGPQGFRAMRIRRGVRVRPLLGVTRDELREYFVERGLSATEDPSNNDAGPLRNWLRQVWLKDLELKRPGAVRAMRRSMSLLAEQLKAKRPAKEFENVVSGEGVDRRVFDALGARDKRLILALYLRRLNAVNVSKSHIDEVIKRLNTYQKQIAFKVGPLQWSINAEQISARVCMPS